MAKSPSLKEKTENAIIALLAENQVIAEQERVNHANGGALLLNSNRDEVKFLPCILVDAQVGTEEPYATGVYTIEVEVSLWVNADETSSAVFSDLMENIIDQLSYDDLAAQLSDLADDFTIHGIMDRAEIPFTIHDRKWVRGQKITLTGCALDF